MKITTERFIRKALYVDAVQVTDENFEHLAEWCQGQIQSDGTQSYIRVRVHTPKSPRQTQAFVGDWILYTDKGYKVYSNKAFAENFDLVEGEDGNNQRGAAALRAVVRSRVVDL
jgi:hypothetical protein